MFLLWGFREYPRATIIYSFILLHKDVFLPLLLSTSDLQTNYGLDQLDDEVGNNNISSTVLLK